MKHIFCLLLLFLAVFNASCEKDITTGDNNTDSPTGSGITEEMMRTALTVPQAIKTDGGTKITVKGYIVAAAENSIKKADFKAPFEGSTCIVLAAKKSNGTNEQFYYDELIPICLTDAAKGLRDTYNLEENNQYWNNFVYISGTRKEYMSVPGIKKVTNLYIDPNHTPTADEETDAQPNGENSDNGESVISDDNTETINGERVYTVSEALGNSGLLDHLIWVKGYIVASAKRSMGSMDFEEPFDSSSAIILSDEKATPDNIQSFRDNPEKLMPVVLKADFADAKSAANLQDHPENWNKLVYIFGDFGETSVGQTGISPAVAIKITAQE